MKNMNEIFQNYDKSIETEELPGLSGTSSLFNQYSVFGLWRVSYGSEIGKYDTAMHYDDQVSISEDEYGNITKLKEGARAQYSAGEDPETGEKDIRSRTISKISPKQSKHPNASEIIKFSQEQSPDSIFGPMPYSWSDFFYCKYYGMIPNNHLITLRRYPLPVYDNAKEPENQPYLPIAQAVTWSGEVTGNKLSEIMKFSYGYPWKEIEARVQDVEGNEQGFGAGIESGLGSKAIGNVGGFLSMARGHEKRWSGEQFAMQEWQKTAFNSDGPYWNQVLGPVNIIHKTHMREMGLNFNQSIVLKFHYGLKSIDGINPKVAMLDLISNFLNLTYSNAKFWGGAMRYFPNAKHKSLFFGDQDKFYGGDWDSYFKSIGNKLGDMFGNIVNFIQNMFSSGDGLAGALGKMKDMSLNLALGKLSSKNRPHILSIRSLLSGDPIGEWHLVIGNPLNPTMMIGNMLVENVEFKTSDSLGADDFPTEVTFTVTLKHGRPRDRGDIESMFNLGAGRMSYAPITSFPSEIGTHGTNYAKQITELQKKKGNENKIKEVRNKALKHTQILGETGQKEALIRGQERIRTQWGPTFADSKNLKWIFTKAKVNF